MKDLYAKLVLLFASADKAQLIRTLEVRNAEIEMLRAQVPKKRVCLTTEKRERLMELGKAIGPEASKLISIASVRPNKRLSNSQLMGMPKSRGSLVAWGLNPLTARRVERWRSDSRYR